MAATSGSGPMAERSGRFPNLLILGAAKSGTSSLHRYLGQHPDIFMSPIKEPEFFVWEGQPKEMQGPGAQQALARCVTDIDSYRRIFGASEQKIAGEASTGYLYSPNAATRIRHHIPDAKLIAILRNPIDRAYSAYLHATRELREPLSDFGEALAAEPTRIRERWDRSTHYTQMGMYAQQLARYAALFPADQIRIYLQDDLGRDALAVVQDAFRFLDVDPKFEPEVLRKFNQGLKVRSARAHVLLHSNRLRSLRHLLPTRFRRSMYSNLRQWNRVSDDSLSSELRAHLGHTFEDEIYALSHMVGRDLSPWLHDRTVDRVKRGQPIGMDLLTVERSEVPV